MYTLLLAINRTVGFIDSSADKGQHHPPDRVLIPLTHRTYSWIDMAGLKLEYGVWCFLSFYLSSSIGVIYCPKALFTHTSLYNTIPTLLTTVASDKGPPTDCPSTWWRQWPILDVAPYRWRLYLMLLDAALWRTVRGCVVSSRDQSSCLAAA